MNDRVRVLTDLGDEILAAMATVSKAAAGALSSPDQGPWISAVQFVSLPWSANHRHGHQRLRVMPFMSPSGTSWRCWIGPDTVFYRNHGAILCETADTLADNNEMQSISMIARYTSGDDNHYFGWQDAENNDARSLADKFLASFTKLAGHGEGWSYAYAGWYQRLLGLADRGWMPVVLSDDDTSSYKKINLHDLRPAEWRTANEKKPSLPLPPSGKLRRNYPD